MRKTVLTLVAACALALGSYGVADAAPFGGGGHSGGGQVSAGHMNGGHYGGGHYGGGYYGGGRHYGGGYYGGGRYYGRGYRGGHGHGHGGADFVFGFGPWWGYPYPYYYAYPYPYQPPVVIESEPDVVIDTPAPPTYWYYCSNPSGYYPYVKQCSVQWMKVAPTPEE